MLIFTTTAEYMGESDLIPLRTNGMNIISQYLPISHNQRKYRRECQGCRTVWALVLPLTYPEIRLTLLIRR
jgi:hypothetical protein